MQNPLDARESTGGGETSQDAAHKATETAAALAETTVTLPRLVPCDIYRFKTTARKGEKWRINWQGALFGRAWHHLGSLRISSQLKHHFIP